MYILIYFYICNCTDTMYLLSINEYPLTAYCGWHFFFMVSEPIGQPLADFFFMAESISSMLLLNTMVHLVTIKLTPTNYLLWCHQFVPLLES